MTSYESRELLPCSSVLVLLLLKGLYGYLLMEMAQLHAARITATFVLLVCATVDGVRRQTAYKGDYSFCEASSLQLAAAGVRRDEEKGGGEGRGEGATACQLHAQTWLAII